MPGNYDSKSDLSYPNRSWLYKSTNDSLNVLHKVSTSAACVQYESCTDAKLNPKSLILSAVIIKWVESKEWI